MFKTKIIASIACVVICSVAAVHAQPGYSSSQATSYAGTGYNLPQNQPNTNHQAQVNSQGRQSLVDQLVQVISRVAEPEQVQQDIRNLVQQGADVNAVSIVGFNPITPLFAAIYSRNTAALNVLLSLNANPNGEPFLTAVMVNNAEAVRSFFRVAADPTVKTANGSSAWEYCQHHNSEACQILKSTWSPPRVNPLKQYWGRLTHPRSR